MFFLDTLSIYSGIISDCGDLKPTFREIFILLFVYHKTSFHQLYAYYSIWLPGRDRIKGTIIYL